MVDWEKEKMKVLVTGNRGYIGSVLTEMLLRNSYEVIGYDIDYYRHCDLLENVYPQKQITKDRGDLFKVRASGIEG